MCKSAAEGGQRCAGHTRPAFQRALPKANTPGHEAEFDQAAIEHATTTHGRDEVEALLAFANGPRAQLRIENLLLQADQLRARREAVTAEVNQLVREHQEAAADTPTLQLVHSAPEVACDTCGGSGLDYDGYWGCEDCGGTGIERTPSPEGHTLRVV